MSYINPLINRDSNEEKKKTKIVRVLLEELNKNINNHHYPLSDIESLAENIKEVGLLDPLLVYRNEDGDYIILSGHRRFEALKMLAHQGYEDYSEVSCKVVEVENVNQEIEILVSANAQRQWSVDEKMSLVGWLSEFYDQLDDERRPPGRKRRTLSVWTNFSERSIQDYLIELDNRQKGQEKQEDTSQERREAAPTLYSQKKTEYNILKETLKIKKQFSKIIDYCLENNFALELIQKMEKDMIDFVELVQWRSEGQNESNHRDE